ncbi:hypothetical protein [Salinicola socius]|uniref:Uncharacterized protein n=1 Tax=Salinicola socius TaxID=404433 RepID=A0A1Q8SWS3_9GAMM|nr:hypothetical protein [Salinicola socius]OLO05850.1 hypothetical protein BTW07_02605 [Salinicola socius]
MTAAAEHRDLGKANAPESIAGSSPAAPLPVNIDPAVWIESLDGMATEATLYRWVSQPRFQHRLRERLRYRHDLAPIDLLPGQDAADRTLCQLDADTLPACIRTAGVIAHANAVAQEIHAPRVAALKRLLGDDLYALTLAHRTHSHVGEKVGDDIEAFEARLERDGRRCLRAWGDSQPAELRAWLRLSWLGQLADDGADADAADDAVEIARMAAACVQSRAEDQEVDTSRDRPGRDRQEGDRHRIAQQGFERQGSDPA